MFRVLFIQTLDYQVLYFPRFSLFFKIVEPSQDPVMQHMTWLRTSQREGGTNRERKVNRCYDKITNTEKATLCEIWGKVEELYGDLCIPYNIINISYINLREIY